MINNRNRSLALVLGGGILSGGLTVLSMPKPDLGLLAWIALVPGMLVLSHSQPRDLLWVGVSCGLVAATGRVYWVAETLVRYGHLSYPMGVSTTALLILYLALYTVAFFALLGRMDRTRATFPWLAAAFWCALEGLQTILITGFPWMLLGYSQYRILPAIQIARLVGVYGVSFLIVLINGTLVRFMENGPLAWRGLLGPALVLAGSLGYGAWQIQQQPSDAATSQPLRVALVQGNFTQDEKWKRDKLTDTVERYSRLIGQAAGADVDFIILPETALPLYFNHPYYEPYRRAILSLAQTYQTPILVGSLEWVKQDGKEDIYNRVFLISKEGKAIGYYDKVHLVPFGEYIPLPFIFQYLKGLTEESGEFARGTAFKTLRLPGLALRFGVAICYESIFPAIFRTFAKEGADFLVTVTNDAWFGRTAAPYQHFAMAVLRAVENGKPLVRVANTGISGAITATGHIVEQTGLFETTVRIVEIEPVAAQTPYTRYGDWFMGVCCVITAGWILWQIKRGFALIRVLP